MKGEAHPFANLIVADDATVRDAMAALSANGREVVLVRNRADRVVGLVTDGDIRRALLRGHTLDSPVSDAMRRDFFHATVDVERAAVLDLMKARSFRHVPVLDQESRLVAIHFLADLIGAGRKPNIAVILAGGQGTRLRPYTENLPKPMVEVAGRPMLERIVLHLVGHGIRRIFLSVNHLAEIIETHFGDGRAFGCQIEYLREEQPLGTGGPLSLLAERPSEPLIVLNGDQITQVDISAMIETHLTEGHVATMAVGPHQLRMPFAVVRHENGRMIELQEKPTLDFLVNRGIYVIDPEALDHVPYGRAFPITDLFAQLIAANQRVGIFYCDDYWLDVGRPADLLRANGQSKPPCPTSLRR